jgi:benzodiazapine receptor
MNILKIIVSILICQAAGYVGSVFTTPAIPGWYEGLNKPSFNPPNSVFAPVWTILYLLMGIALFLVWRIGFGDERIRKGMALFGIQLALNVGWSIAFFGFKSPLAGMLVIVVLWAVILATMLDFFRISRLAAILLVPYIVWVSYAAVLNASLYILNK